MHKTCNTIKRKRDNTKIITDDVLALRKMRISKKITRQAAGESVGVSAKTIERFENGRAAFSEDRKKALIRRYRYSLQEYDDILKGKIDLPDLPARSIYKRRQKTEQERRKYKKIITKRVRIIRSMRKMKGFTQPQAGSLCGYHRSVIDHLENGRIELTDQKLEHVVKSYGYTMSDFNFMDSQKIIRDEVVSECQLIIDQLDNEKLQAVQALLQNFR